MRAKNFVVVAAVFLGLMACVPPPAPPPPPPPPPAPAPAPPPPPPPPAPAPAPIFRDPRVDYRGKEITVWYATNRKANNPYALEEPYGNVRDNKLNFGKCQVLIPKSHKLGSLGGNWAERLAGIDEPIEYQGGDPLAEATFWASVRSTLSALGPSDRRVLVFIHGYNNSFVDAAQRTAQIWADLGVYGVPAFFSWPSKKEGAFGFLQYAADEATIEASEEYLAEFLIGLGDRVQAKDVHVIAHSMGNRALLRVVSKAASTAERRTGKPFTQIILAAPDIDLDVFNRMAAAYHQVAVRTTLYVSEKDRAVAFSGSPFVHSFARVGAPPPYALVENIDTVAVNVPRGLLDLGHAFFAEYRVVLDDMRSLVLTNTPGQRGIITTESPTGKRETWYQLESQ